MPWHVPRLAVGHDLCENTQHEEETLSRAMHLGVQTSRCRSSTWCSDGPGACGFREWSRSMWHHRLGWPTQAALMHSEMMVLPPPCLTIGTVYVHSNALSGLLCATTLVGGWWSMGKNGITETYYNSWLSCSCVLEPHIAIVNSASLVKLFSTAFWTFRSLSKT